jgi:hypothetical protein
LRRQVESRRRGSAPSPFEDRNEIARDTANPDGARAKRQEHDDRGERAQPSTSGQTRESEQPDSQQDQAHQRDPHRLQRPVLTGAIAAAEPHPPEHEAAHEGNRDCGPPAG